MLIGLTGKFQSGKDTVGGILVERHGFKRYAFADQLKSMAYALDPIIPCDNFKYVFESGNWRLQSIVDRLGWDNAKQHPEIRRFLQVLGTEGVREHLGDGAWITALEKKLEAEPYGTNIVITDCRFPNEADAVREWGGEIWKIQRPGAVGNGHASETELEKIVPDRIIQNDRTIGHLKDDLYAFFAARALA